MNLFLLGLVTRSVSLFVGCFSHILTLFLTPRPAFTLVGVMRANHNGLLFHLRTLVTMVFRFTIAASLGLGLRLGFVLTLLVVLGFLLPILLCSMGRRKEFNNSIQIVCHLGRVIE